jgi:biopolymer transport protein TolR
MAMNMAGSPGGGRRGRRKPVMAEINVTPMVDVMLVLLIIFMVAAPLMTVNIQVNLPQAAGGTANNTDNKPVVLTVKNTGDGKCASNVTFYLGETPIALENIGEKITAIKKAKGDGEQEVNIRGDSSACYSDVVKILGLARQAGYSPSMAVIPEQGP